MKKVFFSILAVAAIASCAKTEDVYTEADSEIKLAPVASMVTKADFLNAIDGTEYPAAEHFTVIGYWKDEAAGSTFLDGATTYLNAVDFAKKGNYWAGSEAAYYWPKNGSLRFACYSPTEIAGGTLTHELSTDTWTAKGYTQSSTTASTIDFMIAQTPASYTSATAAENVSVVFEHALSWITLKVKAKDAEAAKAFTINKVTINEVNTVADLTAEYPAKVWSGWTTPAAYKVFSGTQNVTENAADIESTPKGTIVIPQSTTSVTVDYTQNALEGTPALNDQSVTVSLALDAELTPWEPGKHYVYTLIFGLDEILINPSVAEWEEVVAGDIDVTALEVSNEADLLSALAGGKSVRLASDITVSETVVVNGDATLELNGKTLTNKVENTATDVVVVNAGSTLTINGNGNITAVSGNDGYPVIADGTVVINGGTFNAGLDAANKANAVVYVRGNGAAYVNGGVFPNDCNSGFVLNKKDSDRATSVIEVTGGTFTGFNPADNAAEGAGTNFLKAGYTVVADGNVYTVVAE